MVHQHFRLVPPFTVAENVILGDHRGEGKKFIVHPRRIERRVAELGERYRIAVDPRARIWQLSLGEQQRVEILKALYREARILILDEPTAVLTPQEAESLFETLRVMADEGRTIIFISHKLHEVKAVSDRVTVLRDGKTVATVATADATPRSLAALMVGREVVARRARRARRRDRRAGARGRATLWAAGDRGGDALRGVDARRCAPARSSRSPASPGNGQRELAETITGMRPPTRGEIVRRRPAAARRRRARGDPRRRRARPGGPAAHRRRAVALDRLERRAQVVPRGDASTRGPLLRLRAIREHAAELIERYDVRGGGPGAARAPALGRQPAEGRARRASSRASPRVLVVASPTRGLDVAAIETVHRYLREARPSGMSACC